MITGGVCSAYGLRTWGHLFTGRQLVALTTYCELLPRVHAEVTIHAVAAGISANNSALADGGSGSTAYADAVLTYLALGVSRLADAQNSLCQWGPGADQTQHLFRRQALPMIWDYAESNIFSDAAGDLKTTLGSMARVVEALPASGIASVAQIDVTQNRFDAKPATFSTDPPYYDNISYAELADFFYAWLRLGSQNTWPSLFRRLASPKDMELIASPFRHGSRERAEAFFIGGMGQALTAMRQAATGDPITIYYAFKQSEAAEDGLTSAGWSSFLQAVVDAGLLVDGTWPMRTERATRSVGLGANALASSIILVCRSRPADAPAIARADFVRTIKREMPPAIDAIRKAGVGPVDMQQSVIGPGMGVFSRYAKVLEDDDSAMTVKTALALINRVWEEIENELDAAFDPETQVALAWYSSYGFDARASGELIMLTTAKNTSDRALFGSGVFKDLKGKAVLTPREELPPSWTPATDRTLTVWECVQHTARVLRAADGGGEAAARLVAQMGPKSEEARKLAYRLFEIATRKGWSAEARVYNELAEEWPRLEELAASAAAPARAGPVQGALDLEPAP
jgi:putative DNA methylase